MKGPTYKIPVWSYSFLSVYDRCARQGQAQYITKELPYVESPEAAHGNFVHKMFEDRINIGKPFPKEYTNYNAYIHPAFKVAEAKMGVTRDWKATEFFGKDVWGRGKLDTYIISGDNAFLLDWKSGKVREDPTELAVQAVLLKAKHPNLTSIKGSYVWLKEERYGETYELYSMLGRTKDWIEKTMEKVGQGLFYAQPNALCGWCALTACKHWKQRKTA